jgi:hypothetical protein
LAGRSFSHPACAGYNGNTRENRAKVDFSSDSEQVHVIRMFSLWVAAVCAALAVPALAAPGTIAQKATQTTLQVDTRDVNGRTEASVSIAVEGDDGLPATGSVAIYDKGKPVAGLALDPQGKAASTLTLPGGAHSLRAVYPGDAAHAVSNSSTTPVNAIAGTTPDFSVSVAPGTLSLKQGQSGSAVVSIAPINAASLTGPMFVTISCSGIPDQTTCTFTPESIEIPVGATAAIKSSMVLATQAASLTRSEPLVYRSAHPIALAVLFPGVVALGGLAFGIRRRRFLSRLVLIALVGLVTELGTTACSPLYNYYNHGPPQNRPTPPGTYNVIITAQSSNGVTATSHPTTLALTVTQ